MDTAQREFLRARFVEALRKQPDLEMLRDRLLSLGGEEMVPRYEADLVSLLKRGEEVQGTVIPQPMRDSDCHENVSRLWANPRSGLVAIATGYGLSDDGLWRQHSWGIAMTGIVETTEPRIKYFGIQITGREANQFALRSWAGAPLPQKLRLFLGLRR